MTWGAPGGGVAVPSGLIVAAAPISGGGTEDAVVVKAARSPGRSPRSTRPLTGRLAEGSHARSARGVTGPNEPVRGTGLPSRVSASCRTFTSWPLIPRDSGTRSPRWLAVLDPYATPPGEGEAACAAPVGTSTRTHN